MTELRVVRATVHDQELVVDILNDAARRLAERGLDQWPAEFEPGDWRLQRLDYHLDRGSVYLALVDGTTVATMALTDWSDPDVAAGWPDEPAQAAHIYRLAVRSRAAGRAIGVQMINWAESWAHTHGMAWLRLDCSRTNTALHDYYLRLGFVRVGTIWPLNGRKTGALFQRSVPSNSSLAIGA